MIRINSPHVVSNSIGGEVIIINLDSGCYYSLNQSAGSLWEAIIPGCEVEKLRAALVSLGHPLAAPEDTGLEAFINNLLAEDLIIADEATADLAPDLSALQGIFMPPVVERFDDMQELFKLDPIHEVGDAGWPVKKA